MPPKTNGGGQSAPPHIGMLQGGLDRLWRTGRSGVALFHRRSSRDRQRRWSVDSGPERVGTDLSRQLVYLLPGNRNKVEILKQLAETCDIAVAQTTAVSRNSS